MSLLGIDIGTSGSKAAAFTADGARIAMAYREHAILRSGDGRAELDTTAVLASLAEAIRETVAACGADPVRALCVSSMGEAAIPVSREQGVLGNSILSMDTRGAEHVAEFTTAIGDEAFYAINANIRSPAYTWPKLAWLRQHQPALYARTEHFVLWDGILGYLCGCAPFVSQANASRTLLFDIHTGDWSEQLLRLTGTDREKLPTCLPSGAVAGVVDARGAARFGLPRGTPVVVGAHDQCCNALGAGIAAPGRAVDGIGTFECITPVYREVPPLHAMRTAGLNIEHHAVPELRVSFIFNQAGSLVRWFRDTFAAEADPTHLYQRLDAEMPTQPTRLFVMPFFEPSGAPFYLTECSGMIAGLKTSTTRGEILKAIMEGATFYFADCVGRLKALGIDTSAFIATGGGAKSDPWLQMKADIMGVPYHRPRHREAGLAGAAILAGIGSGEFTDFAEGVARFASIERSFEPHAARHEFYRERLTNYKTLFDTFIAAGRQR